MKNYIKYENIITDMIELEGEGLLENDTYNKLYELITFIDKKLEQDEDYIDTMEFEYYVEQMEDLINGMNVEVMI